MSERYPVIGKLAAIFGNWIRRSREIRELRELNNGEFARISQELNMAPADLDLFVNQGPRASDELPELLTRLGLDSHALSQTQPVVLRDMVRVCASCQRKRQCGRDLAAGTSKQNYDEYCPNASTIDELTTTAGQSAGR